MPVGGVNPSKGGPPCCCWVGGVNPVSMKFCAAAAMGGGGKPPRVEFCAAAALGAGGANPLQPVSGAAAGGFDECKQILHVNLECYLVADLCLSCRAMLRHKSATYQLFKFKFNIKLT